MQSINSSVQDSLGSQAQGPTVPFCVNEEPKNHWRFYFRSVIDETPTKFTFFFFSFLLWQDQIVQNDSVKYSIHAAMFPCDIAMLSRCVVTDSAISGGNPDKGEAKPDPFVFASEVSFLWRVSFEDIPVFSSQKQSYYKCINDPVGIQSETFIGSQKLLLRLSNLHFRHFFRMAAANQPWMLPEYMKRARLL